MFDEFLHAEDLFEVLGVNFFDEFGEAEEVGFVEVEGVGGVGGGLGVEDGEEAFDEEDFGFDGFGFGHEELVVVLDDQFVLLLYHAEKEY